MEQTRQHQQTGTLKSVTEYLPPKERVLRSEQIGLSSHKNLYNNGTLIENWIEERNASDYQDKLRNDTGYENLLKTPATLNQIMYQHPTNLKKDAYRVEEPILPKETEKEILFVHGDDRYEQSHVSMTNLTYAPPQQALKTDSAIQAIRTIKPGLQENHAPSRLVEQKKQQWMIEKENEKNLMSTFKTTYAAEIAEKQKLSETSTTSTHIPSEMFTTSKAIIPDKQSAVRTMTQSGGWSDALKAASPVPQETQPKNNKMWGDFTHSLTQDHLKSGLRQPVEYKNTPLATLGKRR
ncbi:predicted protein [Naegleria gruberi]|uniref:Predicted protein n=1 Tax=Naegleria gruberi TaxID=5762 RepID=D2UYT6_NAEGR|nr:uncharacterized protein NAEGRDRAFT_61583 [Naegleria gruberi]EFC50842.1 predicted protein [Naegleria gruberi]|eukprot:XP_002683586.1 predicted protein [Naegleria gruberi strain NEG-M]